MMTGSRAAFAIGSLPWLLVACGGSGSSALGDGPLVADGGVPDAAPSEPDADPARCSDLRFSLSEGEVTAAALRFVDNVNAHGANDAYLSYPPDGTQIDLSVRHIYVDLPGDPNGDPGPAVLAWLAAVPQSPVRPAEYRTLFRSDGTHVFLLRETIEGVRFATGAPGAPGWEYPGLEVLVTPLANGWRLEVMTVRPIVVFATREDATLQRDCTSDAPPPEEAIRSHTFDGLEFTGCAPDGSYHYTPDSLDRIVWLAEGTLWLQTRRTTNDPSERSVWSPSRRLELTIDPANYWERIAHADCYCDGHAGFIIVAHALSGAVLRWWPGINCVVC